MGTNKRYADAVDRRMSDRVAARTNRDTPVTLPQQAYGSQPIEWFKEPRPVWVWVSWRDRPAERLPGVARGANDRVVMIAVDVRGDHWEPVVWRNAVAVRRMRAVPDLNAKKPPTASKR